MKRLPPNLIFALCLALHAAYGETYTVQPGDTLYALARANGVSVEVLMRINGIEVPESLRAGTEIIIPARYVVQRGDTVWGIASRTGMSPIELIEMNSIEDPSMIMPGDVLLLPVEMSGDERDGGSGRNGDESTGGAEVDPASRVTVPPTGAFRLPLEGDVHVLDGKIRGVVISAGVGDPVRVVATGSIIWRASSYRWGTLVIVQTEDGLDYYYGGVRIGDLSLGERVNSGDVLGPLSQTPSAGEAELFFAVYRGDLVVYPTDEAE